MPYTAPFKTSPAAQHIEFSNHHLPHSCPESPRVRSPTGRPALSRSYSSTAYTRRHRRSPSTSKSFVFPANDGNPTSKLKHALDSQSSVRQSPPPLTDAIIPPGAIISPPESGPNSSDEELSYHRPEGLKMEELQAAVRSISQERKPSLELSTDQKDTPPSSSVGTSSPPQLPLSKEARKICHSRSSTESDIPSKHEEALISSPEDSDRDDEPTRKPPMLRKKSGELVRPALRPPSARRRPSSMPGTPTFGKAVHFDSKLEHIRHFLQLDKPLAVSANTSPVEDYGAEGEFPFGNEPSFEWELRLTNFPKDIPSRDYSKVRLERLFLSPDKNTLVGVVAVANLAFNKHVAARFTFDYWKTVSEVAAEYNHDIRHKQTYDGYDGFTFNIRLNDQANLEKKTMFVCIRYNVNGQEFWDNNGTMNYQADFVKVPKSRPEKRATSSSPTLPRSRSFNARPHSMPPSFHNLSNFSFGSPKKSLSNRQLSHESEDEIDPVAPVRRERQDREAFGNRYNFGASLSAAMRSKPVLDRTTMTARAKSANQVEQERPAKKVSHKALPVSQVSRHVAHSPEPASFSGKPHLESSVYKELVDKYCFYGSPQNTKLSDGHEADNEKSTSPTLSPPEEVREPRSLAPARTGSRASSSSPVTLGYSYHQPMQNNFLKESQTPAAIRG